PGIGYYHSAQAYPSGTRFRIYISNHQPAYVYAIGSDLSGEIFQVFPHAEGVSPALNYASNHVAIPDEEHFIETDAMVGTDFLAVLYSPVPLDIKAIQNQISRAAGNFVQQLQSALGQNLVETNLVQYNNEIIRFEAQSGGKSLVAVVVAMDHVN
ncbi:MAG: DUF4384 domain-containing protein, partial [Bacteroidia bacterium]|nr:DUF4384 domain-containing protein [Bacteroidia bacterium]